MKFIYEVESKVWIIVWDKYNQNNAQNSQARLFTIPKIICNTL